MLHTASKLNNALTDSRWSNNISLPLSLLQVQKFYTAPTLIRALMREGDEHVKGSDRSSLQVLGTVGEPINPEAWKWYHRVGAHLHNMYKLPLRFFVFVAGGGGGRGQTPPVWILTAVSLVTASS